MVYFGMVFHMVFVLMNSLIALNLVIAIMSEVINSVRSSKTGLYYSKIIEASPSWKNDKLYGFLISAFIPLNVITLCFLPFCSKMGDKMLEKMNKTIQRIIYSPFLILLLLVFIFCNILLTPFAYCKTLVHKCKLLNDNKRSEQLRKFFFYLFMGPFMLLFSQISDAFWFLVQAYKWNHTEDVAPLVFYKVSLSAFNKFVEIIDE